VTVGEDEADRLTTGARAERRAGALVRAAGVSEELRRAARAVRLAKSHAVARPNWQVGAWAGFQTFGQAWRSRHDLLGLLLFFAAPAGLVVAYFSFVASSQYVSEARFAVRGGERPAVDAISALTGLTSFTQVQDSLITVNYIKSQAIVEDLDRRIGLGAIYASDKIDWLSRFRIDAPIEDFVKYWRGRVKISIEAPSGIVTAQVSAFTPEDALEIAEATVDLSERLVNGLSAQARKDAVSEAESEVARAENRLRDARISLRDLRNEQSTLDPRRTAEGIGRLISELRLEKIRLEQDLTASQRGKIAETAPQNQILRTRIEIISEQIAGLGRLLTSEGGSGTDTIASKITHFDELELERQIAEKQYTLAAAALERARINAGGKKVYLATFVHPVLASDPSYPKRFLFSLLGLGAVGVMYGVGRAGWRLALRQLGR
jgi:capsular polysaccharide transport system permease protein